MSILLSQNRLSFGNGPITLDRPITMEELAQALKDTLEYTNASTDMVCTPAVYKTQAQQLREHADAIEKQDAAIHNARMILATYNKHNKGK